MKPDASFLLKLLFTFTITPCVINAAPNIKFIDDLCFLKKSNTVDLRYENTIILMSVPWNAKKDSFSCQIKLSAYKESSVVLSIYRYDLPPQDQLIIQDSDSHTIGLIGSALFKEEKKSIISPESMLITYKRSNSSLISGFQFTVTQVHESPCMDNEFACKNGKCVLKELACDGHNHCGDNSDNQKCVPEIPESYHPVSRETSYSNVWIISLSALALTLFIITVGLITVIICSSRKLSSKNTSETQSTPSNNPESLQTVSSSVPASNVSAPPSNEPQRMVNAQPREPLYNRIRRSLRGYNNSRAEEVPTRRENYEVPSMYPNLEQTPTAPEIGGTDNAAYKSEE